MAEHVPTHERTRQPSPAPDRDTAGTFIPDTPPPTETPEPDQDDANQRAGRAIAVALEDDTDSQAPAKITASGFGKVAEQILEIAFANGVKVREDAGLAQILSQLNVDSEVPLEALAAVAEILRYVYMANAAMAESALAETAAKP